jgi:anti-anti-sigma factor
LTADCLVLSPQESLVAGAAEVLERRVQQLFRGTYRHLVLDLSGVESIDGDGLRALVRARCTGERVGGTLRLAAVRPAVLSRLEDAHLTSVFDVYGSVETARLAALPWGTIRTVAAGAVLCGTLVWTGLRWPTQLAGAADVATLLSGAKSNAAPWHTFQPFIELAKLVAAALVGVLVTAIHQPATRDRSRVMAQAQVLLCVAGAMMMIIIGNSLARAFGIAGGASIIRFRTPVDDPKDVTVLFLLMGLGMSAGLGAFAVVGLGTAFLCTTLIALGQGPASKVRAMLVQIVAAGAPFPTAHVESVFARNHIAFEPREISQGGDPAVTYHTWIDAGASLQDLSSELTVLGPGVTSVSWEPAKRERI